MLLGVLGVLRALGTMLLNAVVVVQHTLVVQYERRYFTAGSFKRIQLAGDSDNDNTVAGIGIGIV